MDRLDCTIVQNIDVIGFFYADNTNEICRDPRQVFVRERTIDPLAVFSILQYGAVVPPLSPWREIKRLLPGAMYQADLTCYDTILPQIE